MKILILGASSYLGARLYFDLRKDFEVVGTFANNPLSSKFIHLDITNPLEIEKVIASQKPDVIIHTANNANARWCEAHPTEAKLLNQDATQHIVGSANKIKAKVIYISSMIAVNPTNLYGRTKVASENVVKTTKAGYLILRPSLILGFSPNTTNDRPFNRILKSLESTEKVEYDISWKFQPTYIRHVSEVIKQAIHKNIFEHIIPIQVEDLKSRFDVAKDILSPFHIPVHPIDMKDTSSSVKNSTTTLKELNLPIYTYTQIIENIVEEIKNRKIYKLN